MSGVLSPFSRQGRRIVGRLRATAAVAVLAVMSAAAVSAQEILSASVSRDTILIGDQVEWKSEIKVPRGMTVSIDSMSGYVVPGVELIGGFKIDTVDRGRDFSKVETTALITSFDSGSYMLPPLVVYFYRHGEAADTMRLPEVPLEVTTIPVDTASYKMYGIRPQFRYPVTFKEVYPWVLIAVAAAAAVYLIFRLVSGRRKSRPLFGSKPGHEDPPHIVALRDLDRIRSEKLWQKGKEKQYYTDITDTLRVYIERRFGIRTIERTSNEILSDLSTKEISPSDFEAVRELFTTADLVKFAKYTASEADNENAVPVAVRFVNDTFMQELEADKKDE